jgi:uncharacterized protein (UPF0264 family)
VDSVHVSSFATLFLSLSLSAHNASAMADILIKTEKTSLNLLEHQNVTNYTPTAHSVQLDVHVARIERDKTYIFTSN